MTDYRETQLFDEQTHVFRDQWGDTFREPEFTAFELILHDCTSSLAWQILEARRAFRVQLEQAEWTWMLKVFSTWRFYAAHDRGGLSAAHVQAAARKLGISAGEVRDAVRYVEARGGWELN